MKKSKKNYAIVTAASKKMGFAEAPPRAKYKEKNRKPQAATIAFGDFHLPWRSLFSPRFLMLISPKKEGWKILVYFRFLSAQKATIAMIAAITTAAIMAISVVMKGASVAGSGSIGCDGDGAGPTPIAVSAYELK